MGEIPNFTDSERLKTPKTDCALKVYKIIQGSLPPKGHSKLKPCCRGITKPKSESVGRLETENEASRDHI